jgi:hypothetical protein
MSYSIYIGNAVPLVDEESNFTWKVEETEQDDAPM